MVTPHPAVTLRYDLFASHACADERNGHITAFLEALKSQFLDEFPGGTLTWFLDKEDIHPGNDWRRRLSEGVQQSRMFLAFLSPGYFASDWCRKEWHAWLDHEISLHILSQGAFPIYFVEIPELTAGMSVQAIAAAIAALRGSPAADVQRHYSSVRARQHIEVRPFFPEGEQALREGRLDAILRRLAKAVGTKRRDMARIDSHKTTVPSYNRKFTGRRRELTELSDNLLTKNTGVITGVTGLGGIGKTELAFTYAHAYAAHYPGGRWLLRCDKIADLRQALLQLDGHPLPAASDAQRKSLDTHFTHILTSLQDHAREQGRTLLVLDNVTHLALVTPGQTRLLTGLRDHVHLIATTRVLPPAGTGEGSSAHWLTLDRLGVADCIELLDKHRPFRDGDNHDTGREISLLLGCFTLAIHYAALFLAEHPAVTHRDFIPILHSRGLEEIELRGAEEHAEETYEQSEKRLGVILDYTLAHLTPAQRHLLDLTALLGPDHVVMEWLRPLAAQRHPELRATLPSGRSSTEDSNTARLCALGLLSRAEKKGDSRVPPAAPEILRTHRLLQQHLLRQMSDREENQRLITEMVTDKEKDCYDLRTLHERRRLLPPLHGLAERWDELQHPQAATLMNNVAQFWHHLAVHTAAEPLMRRGLDIVEARYGSSHPEVAIQLNNLATLLLALNRRKEAELLCRRALAIDEVCLGPMHPDLTADINTLASLLDETNQLEDAEHLYRRAVSILEAHHPESQPNYDGALNNLSGFLLKTNRAAEAETLCRRALAIAERSLGPDHPNLAKRLGNLAQLLKETNRTAEAEPLCRRALAIDEACWGPDHPEVAARLATLAGLLAATNRLREAEPLYRRALAIQEAIHGLEHPGVATYLNSLAELLRITNRPEEAEPLFRRALSMDEASYGPNHPKVGIVLNNLALLMQATRRLTEAENLLRRALKIDENSYGPEHPNVAVRLNNLAGLMLAANRLAEAVPLYRRVISIFEAGNPTAHPNYAGALGNLAFVLMRLGHPDEAEPLYRRAVRLNEASHGPDHPDGAIQLNGLAALLWETNRAAEAEPLMRRVVLIFLRFTATTGHRHPHLLHALQGYGILCEDMRVPGEEIRARVAKMGTEAGLGAEMRSILEAAYGATVG